MSLNIAATLIVALVAQSSVGKPPEAKAPQWVDFTLPSKAPGFNFNQKTVKNQILSLNASEGTPVYYPAFVNTSAWEFSSLDGVPKITQNMACFSLRINYSTHFSVGDVIGVGRFVAFIGETTFNVTLAARGSEDCKLGVAISAPKLKVRLLTEGLKESAGAFQVPSVSSQLEIVVVKSLKGSLPAILDNLMAKALSSLVVTSNLCKLLKESREGSFPQPVLIDGNSPVVKTLSDILKGFLSTQQPF